MEDDNDTAEQWSPRPLGDLIEDYARAYAHTGRYGRLARRAAIEVRLKQLGVAPERKS